MKVAVIGAGVSGLSATWALNEYSDHQVHLFEPGEYVGGHTHTVDFKREAKQPTPVDTGFIVFNEVTYPNFLRFLKLVNVPILSSDMSFSVTRSTLPKSPIWNLPSFLNELLNSQPSDEGKETELRRGGFEWAGGSPLTLFCQKRNLLDLNHWRMVWDILRFNVQSLETLKEVKRKEEIKIKNSKKSDANANGERFADDEEVEISIGDWLDERGYGEYFWKNYLIPMTSSIWSTPPSVAFHQFPAITLLRFMHNHHLLQILNRPQWLTIKGGSKNYVERILKKLPKNQLHRGESGRINSVRKIGDKWTLIDGNGNHQEGFDEIILATHADDSKKILADWLDDVGGKDDAEKVKLRNLLESFGFSQNEAYLHFDEELMPVKKSAWSAWNFLAQETNSSSEKDSVSLTYWMNLLQSLPEERHGPVLVTLNPPENLPSPEKTLEKYSYQHPIYTSKSVFAQKELKSLQGFSGIHLAGAWLNYGFHEDGFSSGLKASDKLGANLPFDIKSAERALPSFLNLFFYSSLMKVLNLWRRVSSFFLLPLVLIPAILASLVLEFLAAVSKSIVEFGKEKDPNCRVRDLLRQRRRVWEENLGWSARETSGGTLWKDK